MDNEEKQVDKWAVHGDTQEVESHLKQLTFVSKLYDTAEHEHDILSQDMLSAEYVRISKWLEEHGIAFHFSQARNRYVAINENV